jgi:serine/threonine protein phosphatase PrpC
MDFISAYHTDVGIKKATNQDSLLLLEAQTTQGKILLAAVCDGMGGLAQGEIASAAVCMAFQSWFGAELPALLARGLSMESLEASWSALLQAINARILDYSDLRHVTLGTTAVTLLVVNDQYYIFNVGDSRCYLFTDAFYQLTTDQTLVQREMEQGVLTQEQAAVDPRRNVLLQCIGAAKSVTPEFLTGTVSADSVFLLCSDGYRHRIEPREFWDHFSPQMVPDEQRLQNHVVYLSDLNKSRQEDDNISAIAIKAIAGQERQ